MRQLLLLEKGTEIVQTLEQRIESLRIIEVGQDLLGFRIKKQALGENYFGLCPFHVEKTASFFLKPQRNHYICYGCQQTGNPLDLPFALTRTKEQIPFYPDYFNYPLTDPVDYFRNKMGIDLRDKIIKELFLKLSGRSEEILRYFS